MFFFIFNNIVAISSGISIPLFLSFQWSSSQTAHVHVIQQGLLNPSPDVSEMLSEATTTEQGTSSYIIPNLILFNALSPSLGYCVYYFFSYINFALKNDLL